MLTYIASFFRLLLLMMCVVLVSAEDTATKPLFNGYASSIFAYEPTWFLCEPGWGSERSTNAKYQISLAFRLFGSPEATPIDGDVRSDGLYFSYSQTSLWDLSSLSKPFIDSSYRPEMWWHEHLTATSRWGLDALESGFGHESNGKDGNDSRSLNRGFIRTLGHWNLDDHWMIRASPRAFIYIGDLSDNPDIARYRGYADLEIGMGRTDGWWTAIRGRIGNEWNRGSMLVDVTYPLDRLANGWFKGYAHAQWFSGWSESLIAYDQHVEQPRFLVGIALTR